MRLKNSRVGAEYCRGETRSMVDIIKRIRLKIIGRTKRHPGELRNTMAEGMVEEERTVT